MAGDHCDGPGRCLFVDGAHLDRGAFSSLEDALGKGNGKRWGRLRLPGEGRGPSILDGDCGRRAVNLTPVVSFGAGPGVAADVGEETGEVVASAVAVPDSSRTVGVAEEDAVGGRTGACGRRERASATNTAMTTKRRPAASSARCARVRLRSHASR